LRLVFFRTYINMKIAVFAVVLTVYAACLQNISSQNVTTIPSPGINGDFTLNVTTIPSPGINGDFTLIPELSDEFEGNALDTLKWHSNNPTWLGRQPAFFSKNNVSVSDGALHLTMRLEESSRYLEERGYHTYSSAAVRSKYKVKYGFFEIKARAMDSHGSSAFWFYHDTPDLWTEIDVFEICGKGERGNQYNMNVHVFRTPLVRYPPGEHKSNHGEWSAPFRFADDFNIFALEWTPFVIRWYVNGKEVRTIENTHWHQPLTLNFDSETMPDWFGLPDPDDLPSTFSIKYVRSWRFNTAEWLDEGRWETEK
jgi:beta-glucanase (GH16 family)